MSLPAVPMEPIGIIHSPYREKFGIPRQSGLVPELQVELELLAPYARREAVRGLEDCSHLWLIFQFHATAAAGWRPTVRPPRLGGNKRLGVFATRSTHRPNPLGLSAVRLLELRDDAAGPRLILAGADLLDGTPVLDIKPYLPWADALPDAKCLHAPAAPPASLEVRFSKLAQVQLSAHPLPGLAAQITALLAQNPAPAYRTGAAGTRRYGMRLHDFNLVWVLADGVATVEALEPSVA